MTLFRVSPSPPPPKQTKIQMTPNVCHFLQDSLAESRRKKTNVMCNIYPELWEVYHKKSLPKRQKCREKVPKKRQVVKKLFQLDFWVVLLAVPKSRPKKKGVDTLSLTHTDSWYLPGCAIPKRKLKLIFQLPTSICRCFLLLVSGRDFRPTILSKPFQPRCFCHAPKLCHTQLMGQACLLHACLASSRSLRLRSEVSRFPRWDLEGPPRRNPSWWGSTHTFEKYWAQIKLDQIFPRVKKFKKYLKPTRKDQWFL